MIQVAPSIKSKCYRHPQFFTEAIYALGYDAFIVFISARIEDIGNCYGNAN